MLGLICPRKIPFTETAAIPESAATKSRPENCPNMFHRDLKIMKTLIILSLALLFCVPQKASSQAPSPLPPEFSRLLSEHARQRADFITRLNTATAKALGALKLQYMRSGNLDAANKIQAKIEELNLEISGMANAATMPIGAPAQGALPQNGVFSDTHIGIAGSAKITKGNTYRIDVKTTGKAKVVVDAKKPRSSKGEVFIKNGETTILLGTWDSTKDSAWPLQYETEITKAGRHEVEFVFRGGAESISIHGVKIDMRIQ